MDIGLGSGMEYRVLLMLMLMGIWSVEWGKALGLG
jgi:hypothetical protein